MGDLSVATVLPQFLELPHPPIEHASLVYPVRLDPWQLSLKYLNSGTELPSDSVAWLEHGRPFARLQVRFPP